MDPAAQLDGVLEENRVILCVGCGGVGKTTTCAALGLAAARAGKRVLCLTIDPARRLAQSLGLEELTTEAQQISPDVFAEAGLDVKGSLTVMMLDNKDTFDGLVSSLAEDETRRDAVLNNVLYQYISTKLAGTQEYMAMEKLYEVKDDPNYDLILLDTPPTSHALDFLDAPERLVGAIDSAAVRWFLKAFERSGKFSVNILQGAAAAVLKGIGRITGGGFLEQVASFLTEMNSLFGGWRERAEKVSSALRGPGIAYVLVTTPEPMSLREVLFFAERLREQQMVPSAYVVNRVHHGPERDVQRDELAEAAAARGFDDTHDLAVRVQRAAEEEQRLGQLNRLHLIALEEAFDPALGKVPVMAMVPNFSRDIHDVTRLAWVADTLVSA